MATTVRTRSVRITHNIVTLNRSIREWQVVFENGWARMHSASTSSGSTVLSLSRELQHRVGRLTFTHHYHLVSCREAFRAEYSARRGHTPVLQLYIPCVIPSRLGVQWSFRRSYHQLQRNSPGARCILTSVTRRREHTYICIQFRAIL